MTAVPLLSTLLHAGGLAVAGADGPTGRDGEGAEGVEGFAAMLARSLGGSAGADGGLAEEVRAAMAELAATMPMPLEPGGAGLEGPRLEYDTNESPGDQADPAGAVAAVFALLRDLAEAPTTGPPAGDAAPAPAPVAPGATAGMPATAPMPHAGSRAVAPERQPVPPVGGAAPPPASADAVLPPRPLPAAPAADPVGPAVQPLSSRLAGGMADTPDLIASPDVAVPTDARTAVPATAARVEGSLHGRLVGRVLEAVDHLRHAPPPRQVMVEMPDADGLRLQVSLRGQDVHVQVHGAMLPDPAGWARDLGAGLAARGLALGDFGTGDGAAEGGRDEGADSQRDEHQPPPGPTPPRRTDDDGALRL